MKDYTDYFPSSIGEKTAVSLVAHGLNQKPEAMLSLVNWLTGYGSDVYLVKLSGHHNHAIDIKDVTASVWEREMLGGYGLAKKASLDASVALFFVGYSLGALLGQSMIASSLGCAPFDKQILLAPAIATRRRSYLIKLLFLLGKHRAVPSFTPEEYRANRSLPLFIYDILFTEEKKVLKSKCMALNMPTLILMDPEDELVSYKRLLRMLGRFGLAHCRLIILDPHAKDRGNAYHHLIINAETMGKRNWELATAEMKRFLFGYSD